MEDLLSDPDAPSDAELISRVRGGDVAAYGELFSRHVSAANRLGRQLVRGPDVDDLVSEAFTKVLQLLKDGKGPDVAFRAYLLTAVRRLHVDRIRATSKLHTSDDMTQFDPGVPFKDTAVANFESQAASRAFASLPERWQLVLWHLEVEGQKPAEVAPLLGMSANSVSALAYRAREGLRQAFLTMHLSDISDKECRWVTEQLGAYVRKGLSRRDNAKVQDHLDECRQCTAMYLELTEVNSNLAGIIAPLILGAAAAGYLSSSGTAGAAGLFALVVRVRDTVAANAGVATAGAIAAGVVAAATVGILIVQSDDPDVAAGADQTITAPESTSPNTAPPDVPASKSPESGGTKGTRTSPLATPGAPPGAGALVGDLASPTTLSPVTTTGPSDAPTSDPAAPPTTPSTDGASTGPTNQPDNSSSPSPSETTTPPLLQSDLAMSDASIDDDTVVITIQGSPEMPPTLEVELTSSPTGITFGQGGDCPVSPTTPSTATCTPIAPVVVAPLARAVVSAEEATFRARIPLDIPTGQPKTSLKVSVSVPDGYADPDGGNNHSAPFMYDPPKPPEADFALGELQQVSHADGDETSDEYHITSHVTGVPNDVDELFFDLSDNATFGEATGVGDPDCTRVNMRVRCSDLSGDFTVEFVVYLPEGDSERVTITLAAPDGYTDPDPENNSASITLVPKADFALGGLHETGNDGGSQFQVSSQVSGVPSSVDHLTYRLTGKAEFGAPTNNGADCTHESATQVTCAASDEPFDVEFTIELPDDQPQDLAIALLVPEPYSDPDPDNNSAPITLVPPVKPLFDVVLDSLQVEEYVRPLSRVRAVVSGVPASVTEVEFRLSGQGQARFTGGAGGATGEGPVDCEVESETVARCTRPTDSFWADINVHHPPGQASETVTVTVVAVGLDETGHMSNNSRDVTIG